MSDQRVYLDVHVIQTLPPSNINRDDAGSPKTAQYGGVRRARVSSQAWKKAIREYFSEHSGVDLGVRTKRIVSYVAEQIRTLDSSIDEKAAMDLAEKTINKAGVKTDKDQVAKALFFMGKRQAVALAEAAIKGEEDKKVLQEILKGQPEIDIALFGRMVADDPSLNEDASAQVAHAISTHAVQTEFDYYTAMDDKSPQDQAGAGMLGTVEYDSETLYRYANVAVHELLCQLNGNKEEVIHTLKLFVEAFSNSLPSGKINTFANDTIPQVLMVNIRTDRPVNLVSAYEKPVKSSDGYVEESTKRLFQELKKTEKFVNKPEYTFYITQDAVQGDVEGKEEESLTALLADLGQIESLL